MKKLLSVAVTTAFSIGAQKLGQPVPLSNFVVEENSGRSQPAQWKVPAPVLVDQRARPWRFRAAPAQDVVLRRRQQLLPFVVGMADFERRGVDPRDPIEESIQARDGGGGDAADEDLPSRHSVALAVVAPVVSNLPQRARCSSQQGVIRARARGPGTFALGSPRFRAPPPCLLRPPLL